MAETLQAMLQRLLRDHFGGVKSAMASAIGMTASPFGKVAEGATTYFGPEACLRLAKVTGEPASDVLRAAGKDELADLIEEIYGQQKVSPADRQLLDRWAGLSPKARAALTTIMGDLTSADEEEKKPAKRTA